MEEKIKIHDEYSENICDIEIEQSNNIERLYRYNHLRCNIQFSPVGYKIYDFWLSFKDLNVIYATVYEVGGAIEYFATAPIYESRDGEYRKMVYHINTLYSDTLYEILETYGIEKEIRQSRNIKLVHSKYKEHAHILLIKYLLVPQPQHVNINEQHKTMYKSICEEIPSLGKIIGTKLWRDYMFTRFSSDVEILFGFKTRPLSLMEVQSPLDINLQSWREIYICNYASELVLNRICSAPPLFGQWTYITNSEKKNYTNKSMKDLYDRNGKIDLLLNRIRQYRKKSQRRLDIYLHDLISYVKQFIQQSDLSILSYVEDVGSTFHALGLTYSNVLSETDKSQFGELIGGRPGMFSTIYNIMCLHRAGIIHGDMHSNNMTFNIREAKRSSQKMKIIFQIDDDIYQCPYHLIPHIIDFSRSFLSHNAQGRLEEDFTGIEIDRFYREQLPRIFRYLYMHAPKYVEKEQKKVRAFVLSNTDDAQNLLGYMDYKTAFKSWQFLAAKLDDKKGQEYAEGIADYIDEQFMQDLLGKTSSKNFGQHLIDKFFEDYRVKSSVSAKCSDGYILKKIVIKYKMTAGRDKLPKWFTCTPRPSPYIKKVENKDPDLDPMVSNIERLLI